MRNAIDNTAFNVVASKATMPPWAPERNQCHHIEVVFGDELIMGYCPLTKERVEYEEGPQLVIKNAGGETVGIASMDATKQHAPLAFAAYEAMRTQYRDMSVEADLAADRKDKRKLEGLDALVAGEVDIPMTIPQHHETAQALDYAEQGIRAALDSYPTSKTASKRYSELLEAFDALRNALDEQLINEYPEAGPEDLSIYQAH